MFFARFVVALGLEEELSFSGLCALHSLCAHPQALELVEEEQLRAVNLQLSGWLKLANTQCLPPPTSGLTLFTGKKQVWLILLGCGTMKELSLLFFFVFFFFLSFFFFFFFIVSSGQGN